MLKYNRASSRNQPNVGSMLAHRLRRWPNVEPALGESLMFVRREVHTGCI